MLCYFLRGAGVLQRFWFVQVRPTAGHDHATLPTRNKFGGGCCVLRNGLESVGNVYLERLLLDVSAEGGRERRQEGPYSEAGEGAEGAEGMLWSCCADDLKKVRRSSSRNSSETWRMVSISG